ncbi:hypothetical protein HKX48_005574 [Thoreauomyces humboldtii]|nr:hypothetical protein HKX48_005574 [Thoreauomyces humboldtii]
MIDSVVEFDGEEEDPGVICWSDFKTVWTDLFLEAAGNLDTIAYRILTAGSEHPTYMVAKELELVVREVVEFHPAFEFLRDPSSFQDRYVDTIVSRLFSSNAMHSRRLSLPAFRKLSLLHLLSRVERSVNCLDLSMPPVFSYKDFYVIYCRFWKMDTDRDQLLTACDLERYSDSALTSIVCQRVTDLYGSAKMDSDDPDEEADGDISSSPVKALAFTDFVRFIIAAEDKSALTSIEYWFHVLDLEQDGLISLLELETVWAWQEDRMANLEEYTFRTLLTVIWDTLQLDPDVTSISLADLKRRPIAAAMVFDLLFDAKARENYLRRTSDPHFRLAEAVYLDIDLVPGDADAPTNALCDEYKYLEAEMNRDADKLRVQLTGWPRFVDVAYRDLLRQESVEQNA